MPTDTDINARGLDPALWYYAIINDGDTYLSGTTFVEPAAVDWPSYAIDEEQPNAVGDWGGDVPAGTPAGVYSAHVRKRIGAEPAPTDPIVAGPNELVWDGAAVTLPPAGARPVTWAEAKAHLRLDVDTDQAYVESLIDAATDFAETRMGMSLVAQTRTETFHDGASTLKLPRGPLISVTSVTDDSAALITDYDIIREGTSDRLQFNVGFTPPLTVVYQAGYPSRDLIPASIRLAIMMHVATLYENRESVSDRTKTPVPGTLEDFYRAKSRNVSVG